MEVCKECGMEQEVYELDAESDALWWTCIYCEAENEYDDVSEG